MNPRCANRKASVIPGSIVARYAVRISFVEIGRNPGLICGPMIPPSMIIVRRGACSCCASAQATSGTPTPAKTVASSGNCRAPMTASSSAGVNEALMIRSRSSAGAGARARSSDELPRAALLAGEPLAAEEIEIVHVRRGRIHVALEILRDRGAAPRRDPCHVLVEVLDVRFVESVALVR